MTNLPRSGAPLATRCLALTGAFETSAGFPDCFAALTGDFDGMGLSYGVLQWNIGEGTLQPLLSDMLADHAAVAAGILGEHFEAFRQMLAAPRPHQLAWARSLQDSRHAILDPWKNFFLKLGRTAEFQSIQLAHSAKIQQQAAALCAQFGIVTERAFALMFDIAVQNGSIGVGVETKIRRDFAAIPSDADPTEAEQTRLRSIANRRAEAVRPAFIEDVRARKLTIANGSGVVHNVSYDLARQFGIRLQPMAS